MIEIENLSRLFKTKKVLNNLNLKFQTNEFIYLSGSNGAGKTTLLRVLATLLRPSQGDIRLNGNSIFHHSANWRMQVAYTPAEDNVFLPSLTGRQNIITFARFFGQTEDTTSENLKAIEAILDMKEVLDVKYNLASSGMKQKIKIAFAFARPAFLYLLDEPFRSLDKKSREQLLTLVAEKRHNKILVYTDHTHTDSQLKPLTTHTYHLENGRLL